MKGLGIAEKDLVEKFIQGSGKGGQKINKTSSCVFLQHIPSHIDIKCQKSRSRELNRFLARRELCQRLEDLQQGTLSPKELRLAKRKKQKYRNMRRSKSQHTAMTPSPPQTLRVILVASGTSQRMGKDKLLLPLAGSPIMAYSLRCFLLMDCVEEIIVVCPPHRYEALLEQTDLPHLEKIQRVDGGKTRQESVLNGLLALSSSLGFVAIHDAARPLITPEHVKEVLHKAIENTKGAATGRKATDTLQRCSPEGMTIQLIPRDTIWHTETPQILNIALLKSCYDQLTSSSTSFTDEVSALQACGHGINLIENPQLNPKITYPADIPLLKALLDARKGA